MYRSIATLALFAAWAFLTPDQAQAEELNLDSGSISGEVLDASTNLTVYRGIPFAAPPVGDLRWKAPAPVASWDGVRECTEFSAIAPQAGTLAAMTGEALPKTSEDCLYLNVWTTAAGKPDEKLPVMVWIHGGGLTLGWSYQAMYEGSALAKKGVVLVSINYRLGPFGFLSHPELSAESPEGASGNQGFLDQVAALKWVQKNISQFGGDPDRVTIFGESAGGTSVHMLCASPLAKGLFHGAIAQSPWVTDTNVTYLTESVPHQKSAEELGIEFAATVLPKDEEPTLERLRSLSTEEVMSKTNGEFPVVAAVDGHFLNDTSENIFRSGKQNNVPLIVGSNKNEGTMFAAVFPFRTAEAFEKNIRETYGDATDKVLSHYPISSDADVAGAVDQFINDTWFVRNTRFSLIGMNKVSSPAYEYFFTRQGAMPGLGAHHAAEIPYAFNTNDGELDETGKKLADAMIQYWVSFATDGNPNVEGLPAWPQFDPAQQQYLELGDTIKTGAKLREAACNAWDEVLDAELAAAN